MEPVEFDFLDLEDYDLEIVGYDVVPVVAWRKKLRVTLGEVQLIALLGSLGFIATWFI